MTILCFLQNVWVRDPEGLKAIFKRRPEHRVEIIRRLLFAGCLTGRRIKACFGEDMLEHMIFEEASLEIAGDARTICLPDTDHIVACFEEYHPQIVLTFGKIAKDAVYSQWMVWTQFGRIEGKHFISCPHPAARQVDTIKRLKMAAEEIRRAIA